MQTKIYYYNIFSKFLLICNKEECDEKIMSSQLRLLNTHLKQQNCSSCCILLFNIPPFQFHNFSPYR